MGNVNMEAKQIHDRTEAGKHQSVADHLKALDAVAQQIENLPTFTSNDRAFLEGLPAFPSEDGAKVLTATTSSGETSLSYGDIPNELPADPATDGTKVLTATTESGETTLSWEDPESGAVDYSTSEVNTGVKWIDDKDIYRKVVDLGALPNATNKTVPHGITNLSRWVKIAGVANNTNDGSGFSIPVVYDGNNASSNTRMNVTSSGVFLESNTDRSAFDACYAILYYTKTTV